MHSRTLPGGLDTLPNSTVGAAPGTPKSAKHAFEVEVTRFTSIIRRLGKRLSHHLTSTAEMMSLPDVMFMSNLRLYQDSMLGLLKEQRERAKLAMMSKLPELTDAEHAEALEAFRRETLLAMSDGELEKLQAERAAMKAGA